MNKIDDFYIFKHNDDEIIDQIYDDVSSFSSNLTREDLDMVLRNFDYGFCLMDDSSFRVIGFGIIFTSLMGYYIDINLVRAVTDHKYSQEYILQKVLNKIENFGLSQNIKVFKLNDYTDRLIPFYEKNGYNVVQKRVVKGKNRYTLFKTI